MCPAKDGLPRSIRVSRRSGMNKCSAWMDNGSLTRHARHRPMGLRWRAGWSTKAGGANALSGAGSLDTATTCLSQTSRAKNFEGFNQRVMVCSWDDCDMPPAAAEEPLLEESTGADMP